MSSISALVLLPIIASILVYVIRNDRIRALVVKVFTTAIGLETLYVSTKYFSGGLQFSFSGIVNIFAV